MLEHIKKCESKTEEELQAETELKTDKPAANVDPVSVDIFDSQEPNGKIPPVVRPPAATNIRNIMLNIPEKEGVLDDIEGAHRDEQEMSESEEPRVPLNGGGFRQTS